MRLDADGVRTGAFPGVAASVPRVGDSRAVHASISGSTASTAEVDIFLGVDAEQINEDKK